MNVRKILLGNLCLLATLGSMQPQLNAAKKNQKHNKHSSSSSSKSSDKNCCKEIIHDLDKIDKKFGCDKAHVISSVPAVIDKPGKWCVKQDLVYKGSGSAITVTANNVTLNFNNHSLTLTNPSAVGVFAQGVQELSVENDIIQASSVSTNPRSKAFHLINCEKVTLDNIFTANTYFGVHAVSSRDVLVTHSRFKDHIGGGNNIDLTSSGFRADACNAVVIENSTFSGAGKGAGAGNRSVQTIFRDGSTVCRVSNCEFTDIEGAVFGYGVDGLVIEDCVTQTAPRTFNINDPASIAIFRPAIQLGVPSQGEGLQASNVTISNCLINGNYDATDIFNCDPEAPECILKGSLGYGIFIGPAENILVEGCEVSNFCIFEADFSWIHGGLIDIAVNEGDTRPNHITIRDCTVRGNSPREMTAAHGIRVLRADNIIIEGSSVIGTFYGIIPQLSTNLVIRDSVVDGTGHCSIICFGMDGLTIANNHVMNAGFNSMQLIDEEDGLKNVIVEGNTIANGYSSGIFFGNTENAVARNNIVDTVGATGILAVASCINTTIEGNVVTNAGSDGIGIEEAVNTTIQGNTVSSTAYNGMVISLSSNTTAQDNIVNYSGLNRDDESLWDGIFLYSANKTNLIGNTCIGNSASGINIYGGSTATFVQNNTTTQNGVLGINDDDNAGQVTAFFNKSCDNGVINCNNIPFAVVPGDPDYMGANLCCSDPESANAKKANGPIKSNPPKAPGETEKAPDVSFNPEAAF